jgi:hypothetical protein
MLLEVSIIDRHDSFEFRCLGSTIKIRLSLGLISFIEACLTRVLAVGIKNRGLSGVCSIEFVGEPVIGDRQGEYVAGVL